MIIPTLFKLAFSATNVCLWTVIFYFSTMHYPSVQHISFIFHSAITKNFSHAPHIFCGRRCELFNLFCWKCRLPSVQTHLPNPNYPWGILKFAVLDFVMHATPPLNNTDLRQCKMALICSGFKYTKSLTNSKASNKLFLCHRRIEFFNAIFN